MPWVEMIAAAASVICSRRIRPTSTRFAYLAVIDILANLIAYADRNKALETLRANKEELVRNRDGDDRQLLGD